MITDTQRLDWLQNNNKTAWCAYHEIRRASTTQYESVDVFDGWVVDSTDEPVKDIRVAIDRAIEAQKAQKSPIISS